jgi:hypothetical protein
MARPLAQSRRGLVTPSRRYERRLEQGGEGAHAELGAAECGPLIAEESQAPYEQVVVCHGSAYVIQARFGRREPVQCGRCDPASLNTPLRGHAVRSPT